MRSHTCLRALATVVIAVASIATGAEVLAQFRNGNQTIVMDLPRASQRAVVTQRIGLTDIVVTYHRPVAHGRQVFGDVVAYDRIWRAGANDNTTIEFTHPIRVDGQELAAGRYGVHMVPRKDQWTVIFSRNSTSWGSFSYDPAEDALRVRVTPEASAMRDALTYEFTSLSADGATLALSWERVTVPIRLSVDVKAITLASLRNQLRHLPGFKGEHWYEAALYCVDNEFNFDEALIWVDRAIADGERYDNLDLKSQILERLGRKDDAAATLAKALAMASPDQKFLYGERLLREKKTDESERIFVDITTANPESWRAWYGLAKAQVARGDRKAAERSLTEALNRAVQPGEKAGLKRMLERLAAGLGIG